MSRFYALILSVLILFASLASVQLVEDASLGRSPVLLQLKHISTTFYSWFQPSRKLSIQENVALQFFSSTYKEAREKFIEAANDIKAPVFSFPIAERGEHGEELAVDIAVVGSMSADRVLIHSSGVHGVEGFAGSAIQVQFLRNVSLLSLDTDNVAVVLVHAVNPFGMAWGRRWNEHNVDLNRNSLTDAQRKYLRKNPNPDLDKDFLEFCTPKEEPPISWTLNYITGAVYYIANLGYNRVKQAIAGGQGVDPNGLFYVGGTSDNDEPEPTLRSILSFLHSHFGRASHYVEVDVHTGLGPKGVDTLLVDRYEDEKWLKILGNRLSYNEGSEGLTYTILGGFPSGCLSLFRDLQDESWPQEFDILGLLRIFEIVSVLTRMQDYSFLEVASGERDEIRLSTKCYGNWFVRSYHGVTQEFGTYSGMYVLKTLREENFYYNHESTPGIKDNRKGNEWSRDNVVDAFYLKNDVEWKLSVLQRGRWLIDGMLTYLQAL